MKNQFTKGPYKFDHAGDFISVKEPYCALFCDGVAGINQEGVAEVAANKKLLHSAFYSATKLADMGLDAQATIEALPEILAQFRAHHEHLKQYNEDVGGCDHSVGICACGLRHDLESAEAIFTRCKGAE